jgi:hypothetical protein
MEYHYEVKSPKKDYDDIAKWHGRCLCRRPKVLKPAKINHTTWLLDIIMSDYNDLLQSQILPPIVWLIAHVRQHESKTVGNRGVLFKSQTERSRMVRPLVMGSLFTVVSKGASREYTIRNSWRLVLETQVAQEWQKLGLDLCRKAIDWRPRSRFRFFLFFLFFRACPTATAFHAVTSH